ncbi:hypothetical protein [Romboutsia lituseburensis]|uniref:Uncharacterized protein n=1 Tax=Romboutsia lituseburensis DSM 797 TaxID=1121325 RepID=A0A1G9QHD2_9FIRM|nr:hypothetical protein [Romboutsia lituseburensis]CEH35489.1 Hypothetical protein RLITU_2914 [Romboutsia lituseburensis]SDM09695.1 hypothetical protein SAMN04515677_105183 [Romboutsia lituseburensis DSM 797]
MLRLPLSYILIRTFPESLVIILVGMILLGIKIDIKNLIKKGIFLGVVITAIRMLPINFGVHTILAMIVLAFILYKSSSKQLVKSIIATCCIWISLALSEGIYILIATKILGVPFKHLTNTQAYGAIITLPSLLILIGIAILIKLVMDKLNILLARD